MLSQAKAASCPNINSAIERWHPVLDSGDFDPASPATPDLQMTQREYDAIASSYVQVVSLPDTMLMERDRISFGVALAKEKRTSVDSVLDVGCAGARDLTSWMEHHVSYYGMDFSISMLRLALRNAEALGCSNSNFMQANIIGMSVIPNSIDIVWCSSVIQHVPHSDLENVLGKFFRALKPGGILYLNVRPPKEGMPIEGMICSTEYQRDNGDKLVKRFIAHYSIDEMNERLKRIGFVIENAEQYKEVYDQYNLDKATYLPEKFVVFARKPELDLAL